MGCDKTEVWNVKLQRGLGILPSPIKSSIDKTRTIGMYLPWATVFFSYLLYFGRVGYSNMVLRAPYHVCIYLFTPSVLTLALSERD